jgi:hypothetical protein
VVDGGLLAASVAPTRHPPLEERMIMTAAGARRIALADLAATAQLAAALATRARSSMRAAAAMG